MRWLKGKRILVVEDEALIAVMVEDMIADMGGETVGPAATIEEAMRLAEAELDGAILDVNVRGERIDPVAERLMARGVPVLFATGYGEVKLPSGASPTVIDKPYTQDKLSRGLAAAMGTAHNGLRTA